MYEAGDVSGEENHKLLGVCDGVDRVHVVVPLAIGDFGQLSEVVDQLWNLVSLPADYLVLPEHSQVLLRSSGLGGYNVEIGLRFSTTHSALLP